MIIASSTSRVKWAVLHWDVNAFCMCWVLCGFHEHQINYIFIWKLTSNLSFLGANQAGKWEMPSSKRTRLVHFRRQVALERKQEQSKFWLAKRHLSHEEQCLVTPMSWEIVYHPVIHCRNAFIPFVCLWAEVKCSLLWCNGWFHMTRALVMFPFQWQIYLIFRWSGLSQSAQGHGYMTWGGKWNHKTECK